MKAKKNQTQGYEFLHIPNITMTYCEDVPYVLKSTPCGTNIAIMIRVQDNDIEINGIISKTLIITIRIFGNNEKI